MKKSFFLFFLVLVKTVGIAQTFEGEIVYKNTYKSKTPNVTDEQFTAFMGDTQQYYIKGNTYKSIPNGQLLQWQLYDPTENRLYTKMASSETLYFNEASENKTQGKSIVTNKKAITILGYLCDEIIVNTEGGFEKYYFNSALAVNADLFKNHLFGNWYEYLSKARALPLKILMSTPQFESESTAVKVNSGSLEEAFFQLPENIKIIPNPNSFQVTL